MSYGSSRKVRPAGFFSRLVAFMIDLVIISVISTLLVTGINEILTFFGVKILITRWINSSINAETINSILKILVVILYYIFSFFYFAIFYALISYTPGKYLIGLRVVRTDGYRLGFWKSALRAMGYYLSALLLFMGFFWIIIDKRRQGLHDKIAGTVVIYN